MREKEPDERHPPVFAGACAECTHDMFHRWLLLSVSSLQTRTMKLSLDSSQIWPLLKAMQHTEMP